MPDHDENKDAVELIRSKITNLYAVEPNAREEASEAEAAKPRSKHQQFMHELSTSGKSLAEIQTAWHEYYVKLSDGEKHEVWREFYAQHNKAIPELAQAPVTPKAEEEKTPTIAAEPRTTSELKQQLLKHISKRAKLNTKHRHQLKSLAFGLSAGVVVLVIMLFGFFNERFIAPFITPSYAITSTPIITEAESATVAVSPNPVIIIPKINIEIPVVYDEPSIEEADVQKALERGIYHYPTTSNPGEQGNAAFFGHSSNNIFNNGKYKFAFVLLNRLDVGDTFMVQKDGIRYVYKIFEKRVVPPTEVSILDAHSEKPATATLVTCDPPGANVNRLIVVGEQISPDPAVNVASSAPAQTATPTTLPSEAPTLWGRFWKWLNG